MTTAFQYNAAAPRQQVRIIGEKYAEVTVNSSLGVWTGRERKSDGPALRWSQVTRYPSQPPSGRDDSVPDSTLPFSMSLFADRGTNPHHHGSHLHLLSQVTAEPVHEPSIDAIVIPTARPARYLTSALATAKELDCPVLALCSQHSSASEVARLARMEGVELTAVDIDQLEYPLLPSFRTSELIRFSKFRQTTDVSFKRNLGLLVAKMAGWERITYLDDDLLLHPADVETSARLLDSHTAVGFADSGFPDNSVVCHAYRETGGHQDTFVGAGALSVSTSRTRSFFPNIYNSDWFFLLDGQKLHSVALTGEAHRPPYDPFQSPRRARGEELGEDLAEGIYWILDEGGLVSDAKTAFWKDFLSKRIGFITDLTRIIQTMDRKDSIQQQRRVESLKASRGRCHIIDPELCTRFIRAWQEDMETWNRFLESSPNFDDIDKVLFELGILPRSHGSKARAKWWSL